MAANPSFPPIPTPIGDLNGLTFVSNALKQRVDNIASYVLSLRGTVDANAAASTGSVAYTLPVASTSVLGGVKIDGTTVTILAGVISATGAAGSIELPQGDGIAAIGGSERYARADHVHPTDTSRYAASNPASYTPRSEVDLQIALLSMQTQARIWFD